MNQIFPVEILRSILPMVIGGLQSTQRRIRQSTYRFVIHGSILGGLRLLREEESVELLRATEEARNTYDSDIYLRHQAIRQITGWGEIVKEAKVEALRTHPLTLIPKRPLDGQVGTIRWVWYLKNNNREYPLGEENTYSSEEMDRRIIAEQERKQRDKERLARNVGKGHVPEGQTEKNENHDSPDGGHGRDQSQDETRSSSQPSQQNHRAPPTSSLHPPTACSRPPTTHAESSQRQTPTTSQSAAPNSQSSQPEYDIHMPPPDVDWRSKSRPTASSSTSRPATSHTSTSSRKRHHDDDEPTSPNKKRELESDHARTSRPPDPKPSTSNQKRSHDDEEPSPPPKKRKLKCDWRVPAETSGWKPDWLKTTQCYPVDANDEELSDMTYIWGDTVYRRLNSMKRILEEEYMYIPTHEVVDTLLRRANEALEELKTAKKCLNEYPHHPIRIVRDKIV
jgi:hypothetical protein